MMHGLEKHWQAVTSVSLLLWPISLAYYCFASLRRWAYRYRLLDSKRLPVPVVVVGNITVGGTGKTPLVIWLARFLKKHGFQPGIVSRGYGGSSPQWPQAVAPDSDPAAVGDEPVLLARHSGCPVVVDPDRVQAAQILLEKNNCDLIVSDDGLQHYRLERDVEIAVIDGQRRYGNGLYLPAGPLRESVARLRQVDLIVTNGKPRPGELGMTLQARGFRRLRDPQAAVDAATFRDRPVHAVAGIGNPNRFFDTLRALGLAIREHPFPDHHRFQAENFQFDDDLPVIMTEKDAVKCRAFAGDHYWFLAVEAQPDPLLGQRLLQLIKENVGG